VGPIAILSISPPLRHLTSIPCVPSSLSPPPPQDGAKAGDGNLLGYRFELVPDHTSSGGVGVRVHGRVCHVSLEGLVVLHRPDSDATVQAERVARVQPPWDVAVR
jgi:hypothetical protein